MIKVEKLEKEIKRRGLKKDDEELSVEFVCLTDEEIKKLKSKKQHYEMRLY